MPEEDRARVRGRCVGFVFQTFQLIESLTALENVMLPSELRGESDAGDDARMYLDRVGLADRLTHYPRQLSRRRDSSASPLPEPSPRVPRCCSRTNRRGTSILRPVAA